MSNEALGYRLFSLVCHKELRELFLRYCVAARVEEVCAHPYLQRKGVSTVTVELFGSRISSLGVACVRDVARLLRWWPRVGGKNLRDPLLLVPLVQIETYSEPSVPWSFQLIDADGRKAFLPEIPVRECYWAAKPLGTEGWLFVTEGVATALTVQASLQRLCLHGVAIAALSLSNVRPVAHKLRRRFGARSIVFCAEVGTEGFMQSIADEVGKASVIHAR